MSVDFRQRRPSEYLKILRRRKWLLILPMIAIASAVAYVVYRLPDVYESTTLIVVRPSTLPTGVIPTATEDALTRQLASISQVVTSRSSLEPLVAKYKLYEAERGRGEPMELVIQKLHNDIRVEINTGRNDITNGFIIAFRYRDPKIAQAITSELASKYIDVQNKDKVSSGEAAKRFIDDQVDQAKAALDEVDKRRFEFLSANLGSTPSEAQGLFTQLNGLREAQKAIIAEVGRLQDRRAAAASNLVLLKESASKNIDELAENITDPKTTLGWANLVSRKAQLEGELTRLQQELTDKHPDVIAKKKEVEKVQEDMDQQIADWQDKIKAKTKKLEGKPNLNVASLESEINFIDGEIKRQQRRQGETEDTIASIVGRINNVPGVEVQLTAIDRDYQTKKVALEQLQQQQQRITLNRDADTQQQSETIQVIDSANLPTQPVAPKRLLLSTIGIAVGLGLGLLLTLVLEGPRMLTIQNTEDARHYTGLPVLLAVPELLTPREARAVPRRRRLILAAGMVATLVSIPMLALALKLTHVFEYLMQASSGRS